MKPVVGLLAAGLLAASLIPLDASAASLLGGLVKIGKESGNSNRIVSIDTRKGGASVGLLGSDGVSVNLGGDSGGKGVTLPVDLDSVDVDVPGVAAIKTDPAPGGGTRVDVELLGGGGGSVSTNPAGVLGNGGVSVKLPDLGNVANGNGNGGGNGGNGGNGGSGGKGGNGGGAGGNGGNGGSGGIVVKYLGNGGGGDGFVVPEGISSRLQALLRILAERDYLRISDGRAVCLDSFGVAEVAGWVPQKEWGKLQRALTGYSQDIYVLRQLLANCRSAAQRQALNLTQLNRVIAIDIGKDGQPILFLL